jgi:hypothetical protein
MHAEIDANSPSLTPSERAFLRAQLKDMSERMDRSDAGDFSQILMDKSRAEELRAAYLEAYSQEQAAQEVKETASKEVKETASKEDEEEVKKN